MKKFFLVFMCIYAQAAEGLDQDTQQRLGRVQTNTIARRNTQKISPEIIAQIEVHARAGESTRDIAQKLNTSRGTVIRKMKKLDIESAHKTKMISPEIIAQIIDKTRAGQSYRLTAEELSIGHGTVHRHVHKEVVESTQKTKVITPEQIALIEAGVRDGKSYKKIGKELNVDPAIVRIHAQRAGLESVHRKSVAISPEKIAIIRALKLAGKSNRKIAQELSVSRKGVAKYANQPHIIPLTPGTAGAAEILSGLRELEQ